MFLFEEGEKIRNFGQNTYPCRYCDKSFPDCVEYAHINSGKVWLENIYWQEAIGDLLLGMAETFTSNMR